MFEIFNTIAVILAMTTIAIGVVWRFSVILRKIVEAYENDGKIDKEEFVDIYNENLKFLKWLVLMFGVNIDNLITKAEDVSE